MTTHFAWFNEPGNEIATCPGRIASITSIWNQDAGTIVVRDLLFGAELFVLRLGSRLLAVAFSPSGDRLVAITDCRGGNFIRVFDGRTGRKINRWQLRTRSNYNFKIVFSPDGSQIFVVAPGAGRVRAFDGECRRELWSAQVPNGYVKALAVSPDGAELVAVCESRDGDAVTVVWSASTGAELRRVPVKQRLPVASCVFAPDARSFSVFEMSTIAVIDAGSGDPLWRQDRNELRQHEAANILCAVSYSPDSRFVLCGACSSLGRGQDAALIFRTAADGREVVARVPVGATAPGAVVTINSIASALVGRIIAVSLFDGSRALKMFSNCCRNI